MVPRPRARIWPAMASRLVTCPVKLVSTISAARRTSRSTSGCGIEDAGCRMTMSSGPSAKIASAKAWWVSVSVAS